MHHHNHNIYLLYSIGTVCPYGCIDVVFLIDIIINEEGFYVYNLYNIVDEHFSIGIEPVRSRGGSLVT
jgi:hypothetical protein